MTKAADILRRIREADFDPSDMRMLRDRISTQKLQGPHISLSDLDGMIEETMDYLVGKHGIDQIVMWPTVDQIKDVLGAHGWGKLADKLTADDIEYRHAALKWEETWHRLRREEAE